MIKLTRRGAATAFSVTSSLPATAPFLFRRPVGARDMFEATAVAIATIAFQRVLAHMHVWTLLAIATVAFVVVCADLFLSHRQQARNLTSSTETDASFHTLFS